MLPDSPVSHTVESKGAYIGRIFTDYCLLFGEGYLLEVRRKDWSLSLSTSKQRAGMLRSCSSQFCYIIYLSFSLIEHPGWFHSTGQAFLVSTKSATSPTFRVDFAAPKSSAWKRFVGFILWINTTIDNIWVHNILGNINK